MIKLAKRNIIIITLVLVFIVLLLHPLTRPVMLFILPLGAGPDDLIMIALTVIFIFLWSGINKK